MSIEPNQIESPYAPSEISIKETLLYESRPETGILAAISNYPFVRENTNDIVMFERYFQRWHTHILLQKIAYYQTEYGNNFFDKDTKPYVIIETLGVFDNLKSFGRRLQSEIDALLPKKAISEQDISIYIIYRDSLEIRIETPDIKFELLASVVKMNQEAVFGGANDILKFGLPTE